MSGTKAHHFHCQILFLFVLLDTALVQGHPNSTAAPRVFELISLPPITPNSGLSIPSLDVSPELQHAIALHACERSQTPRINDTFKRLKLLSRAPLHFPALFPASLFPWTLPSGHTLSSYLHISPFLYNPTSRVVLSFFEAELSGHLLWFLNPTAWSLLLCSQSTLFIKPFLIKTGIKTYQTEWLQIVFVSLFPNNFKGEDYVFFIFGSSS